MKYQLFNIDGHMAYEANGNELFSLIVAVQFPLGDFVRIDDCGDKIVITYTNYWIEIKK